MSVNSLTIRSWRAASEGQVYFALYKYNKAISNIKTFNKIEYYHYFQFITKRLQFAIPNIVGLGLLLVEWFFFFFASECQPIG